MFHKYYQGLYITYDIFIKDNKNKKTSTLYDTEKFTVGDIGEGRIRRRVKGVIDIDKDGGKIRLNDFKLTQNTQPNTVITNKEGRHKR